MTQQQTALISGDGRVFYDMADSSPCAGCGVCCRHFRISFYHGELDTQPGGFVPADMAVSLTPFLACMAGTESGGGQCSAQLDDGRCGIYSSRPTPCREFRAVMDDGTLNPVCVRLREKYLTAGK